ncbi:unnamed protein product [Tilletia controversa]|nr:unnamed protein product [Tilletia controversa]
MGGATGPPSIPPSLLLDPALPPYSTLAFPAHLQDLACRFIVNLPADELTSIERICFQVEQAHWFYEDFLRPLNPTLPSLNLRRFSTHLLSASAQIVPFIKQYVTSSGNNAGELEMNLEKAFDDFLKYKTRVPVCGVIMLDEKWEKCLLVKGWKSSAAWGFPKGKINHSESTRDCAVREVYEETGFDCGDLLPSDSKDFLELTMREQKIRLYVVPGVSENTHFETLTRKEISKIAWFLLRDLPAWKHNSADGGNGKFYSVAPFAGRLKAWISQNRKTHPRRPMVKQGAIDITEAAQAVEEDQDEAEAAQAEQTRHLLDRLFAPIQTVEEEKTSASDGILDPLTLPTGTALLDHLFGKSSSEVPSDAAEPGAPPAPVGPPANGQVLLDILFGKHEATQPPAPAAALATATTPSPAPLNGNGQVLLDMLLAPRRSSGAVPTPTNASNSNGPTSSAQALLNSLFAAASSASSDTAATAASTELRLRRLPATAIARRLYSTVVLPRQLGPVTEWEWVVRTTSSRTVSSASCVTDATATAAASFVPPGTPGTEASTGPTAHSGTSATSAATTISCQFSSWACQCSGLALAQYPQAEGTIAGSLVSSDDDSDGIITATTPATALWRGTTYLWWRWWSKYVDDDTVDLIITSCAYQAVGAASGQPAQHVTRQACITRT